MTSAPRSASTRRRNGRRALPIAVPRAIVGVLGLFVAVFVVWAMLCDDPLGGEPMVVVAADQRTASTGRKGEDANARPLAQGAPERPQPLRRSAGGAAAPDPARYQDRHHHRRLQRQAAGNRDLPGPADKDNKSARRRSALARELAPRPAPEDRPRRRPPGRRLCPPGQGRSPASRTAPRIAIVIGGLGIGAASTERSARQAAAGR